MTDKIFQVESKNNEVIATNMNLHDAMLLAMAYGHEHGYSVTVERMAGHEEVKMKHNR